ncbi:DUF2000 domain-containing protein [Nocardiopsis gilva YIM 90087]|uniref:DUF2000 domain-containing protein n=1 Tax=Nocardiopsis gilva YIM 90087 TaxID=1235441 RepID=A0A223S0S1_9ACTN|nr:DUF2000 domain-containing protein [Nocardiopsis gilva YIM 90087]
MSLRTKLVLVVDERLDRAQATNAAVVTGLSMGGRLPGAVAADGRRSSGGDGNTRGPTTRRWSAPSSGVSGS